MAPPNDKSAKNLEPAQFQGFETPTPFGNGSASEAAKHLGAQAFDPTDRQYSGAGTLKDVYKDPNVFPQEQGTHIMLDRRGRPLDEGKDSYDELFPKQAPDLKEILRHAKIGADGAEGHEPNEAEKKSAEKSLNDKVGEHPNKKEIAELQAAITSGDTAKVGALIKELSKTPDKLASCLSDVNKNLDLAGSSTRVKAEYKDGQLQSVIMYNNGDTGVSFNTDGKATAVAIGRTSNGSPYVQAPLLDNNAGEQLRRISNGTVDEINNKLMGAGQIQERYKTVEWANEAIKPPMPHYPKPIPLPIIRDPFSEQQLKPLIEPNENPAYRHPSVRDDVYERRD